MLEPRDHHVVRQRLETFSIPQPRHRLNLGDIEVVELEAAQSVARVAAFAASVRGDSGSNLAAVHRIGKHLGSYAARTSWVRNIACPVLGSGAGGLPVLDAASAITRGFLETAPNGCLLRLFVIDEISFGELRRSLGTESSAPLTGVELAERPIRVFISYTQTSPDHAVWVKTVAAHLRENGIDARLDVWHLTPGTDVAQWMCTELDLADRVLLICDDLYSQKADRRHGGVGWEVRLVQGDLLQSQVDNPDKYVPVFARSGADRPTPAFLKSVYGMDWPTGQRDDPALLASLVQILYRVHEQAPPLGRPPSFVLGATSS